ncbi:MRC1-like protein [Mya arenaria]|uniref:MRC1-like protein n=1 Tax=Mya arenaria TaxID=6604 RepID=A0ABY7EQY7_MYAAR|nr:MRC1-like protein [Mya arenaria]
MLRAPIRQTYSGKDVESPHQAVTQWSGCREPSAGRLTVVRMLRALSRQTNSGKDAESPHQALSRLTVTRETEDGFHGDNLKCSWQIVAPSNWRVKVTVTQLDLDWSSSYSTCDAYDRVNIWEGSNQEGEKLTAICVAWNPGTILSVGNSVFLQFSSTPRNAYQRRGVEMFFEIYDPSNCPPGWIPVPSSSSECLMVERNLTADWSRSQDICKFNKANLASLHSIDEMDALFLTGTGKGIFPAWIGLNDKDGNGQFTWIDRSDLSFQRSIVNQSYKNLCVAQGFDATDWLARECREKLPYICRGNKDGSSILYNEGNEPPPQEGTGYFMVSRCNCHRSGTSSVSPQHNWNILLSP